MNPEANINSVDELWQKAKLSAENVGNKWIYALYTDGVMLKEWKSEEDCPEDKKLLELRLFWQEAEYKAFRGNIGGNFYYRIRQNDDAEDYYDEEQFLDGDMGKLHIRNYVSYYEESGQAYVSDWRMMVWEGSKDGRE